MFKIVRPEMAGDGLQKRGAVSLIFSSLIDLTESRVKLKGLSPEVLSSSRLILKFILISP